MAKASRPAGEADGLFGRLAPAAPLADRLRPATLAAVVGQDHVLGPDGPLGRMVAARQLASLVLWGPPGCGKTTIARLLATATDQTFVQLSAVFSGVGDLRRVFDEARGRRRDGQGTVLFVDEIHRFNRAQQDAFLPVVEDGSVTLIGATTENPSFELNAALMSRLQVMVLRRLDDAALEVLLTRAEAADSALPLTAEARGQLKAMADGDGRALLNLVEEVRRANPAARLTPAELAQVAQRRAPVYDKAQDSHFNLISALHKSLRGSDPDAGLYWLARMLDGGEDPRYIARRLVRFAVEDVGLADPAALSHALAGWQAYERLGQPEGELAIAQVVVHLATAPKSNAVYVAYKGAMAEAKATGSLPPPAHILNAPTGLMKDLGYGAGYAYDHDVEGGFSGQDYFPDDLARRTFYRPKPVGAETAIAERVEDWARRRRRLQGDETGDTQDR